MSDDLPGLGVVLDGICRIIAILDEIFQSSTFLNGERDGGRSLPASSPSPKPSGRYGVEPLRMENSIAAMPAMRVTHTTPNVRFTSRD